MITQKTLKIVTLKFKSKSYSIVAIILWCLSNNYVGLVESKLMSISTPTPETLEVGVLTLITLDSTKPT